MIMLLDRTTSQPTHIENAGWETENELKRERDDIRWYWTRITLSGEKWGKEIKKKKIEILS